MSDILSAASMFFAVIGVLYGVWYGEIRDTLGLEKPLMRLNRGPALRKIKSAQRFKAVPLAVIATLFAVVLFPDYISVLISSCRKYHVEGFYAIRSYDAVRTLFSAIVVISCVFSVHMWHLVFRLHRQYYDFNKPDKS